MYHIAKHVIKFLGFTNEYEIFSTPIHRHGTVNDMVLTVSGLDPLHESHL